MTTPLLSFRAKPHGPKCPFSSEVSFQLREGSCILLKGNSGVGKTTLSTFLAGLSTTTSLHHLDIEAHCQWNPLIPPQERCGVLFQQTTLLDELTVAGNVSVALEARTHERRNKHHLREVKQLLESVGLDYARDGSKRPSELSGGMARRASLALQLAQKKRVIVLDEPFTGLDERAATSVAKELLHLRVKYKTALLLISHEPAVVEVVMDKSETNDNHIVYLETPKEMNGVAAHLTAENAARNLVGTTFWDRFCEKVVDYIGWSLPLILLTFLACGLAISMLSADILKRIDVTDQVMAIVETEVKPLIKMFTGEDPSLITMMGIKLKVRGMLDTAVPQAKSTLYAMGMAKLFVLEIGPLLTALLLCGRIGGSYAGKVATMRATSQWDLLKTLGISPIYWILAPSLCAALLASPLLTIIGTSLALALGCLVGPKYGIGTFETYREQVEKSVFPEFRVMDSFTDMLVEITTYPIIFHWLKSVAYILIILLVAEVAARLEPNLTPRKVPHVITTSVVMASLIVIVADWGFSQLWLLRK